MSSDAESRFRELLAYAEADDDVVALFVFGSRARQGFADDASDYDVGVVVREEALVAFDRRWPYEHGAPVEIASTTPAGLPSTPSREHRANGRATSTCTSSCSSTSPVRFPRS